MANAAMISLVVLVGVFAIFSFTFLGLFLKNRSDESKRAADGEKREPPVPDEDGEGAEEGSEGELAEGELANLERSRHILEEAAKGKLKRSPELLLEQCKEIATRFVNPIDVHNDVLWYCPQTPKGTFNRMVAAQVLKDGTLHVIGRSNSYFSDQWTYSRRYNNSYRMLKGLTDTIEHIKTAESKVYVKETTHVFANAFSGTNAGHELSVIMGFLHQLGSEAVNSIEQIAIYEKSLKIPRVLEILELFIPKTKWLVLKPDTCYEFRKGVFLEHHIFNLDQRKDLIQEVIRRVPMREDLTKNGAKKIVLIKMGSSEAIRKQDAYHGEKTLSRFEREGFALMRPENMHMYDIITMLRHAKVIVISSGGIMYVNQYWFNPEAHVYSLEYMPHNHAYPYVRNMKHYHAIRMKSTDMDACAKDMECIFQRAKTFIPR